ncbi:hypothetical protein RBSH_01929 [Rhodopirellula baltica SH28]|uniref:Uncharacterized protein n=1 Tax=Rhodopirellula baltica SH28 TaxID=993517 RepID=K5DIW9_RHOBT|nr:hypothetical protein RBSH_01929 [Rhodopirellula baltica SH28]
MVMPDHSCRTAETVRAVAADEKRPSEELSCQTVPTDLPTWKLGKPT